MAWARLDDQFWSNTKIIAAGNMAVGIYARALSYCAANQTDGFVPMPVARQIGGQKAAFRRLVGVGLAVPVTPGDKFLVTGRKDSGRRKLPDVEIAIDADGYYIRDFLHFNRARTDARANESADERADVQIIRTSESTLARAARPDPALSFTNNPPPQPTSTTDDDDLPPFDPEPTTPKNGAAGGEGLIERADPQTILREVP